MRRLVYSPKVEVYVKADTGIYDLSPYVTRCSVNRKVNQVSSAQVTFRNPNFMFTENVYKDPITKKTTMGPVFHPMDPIVISMTRLRDRPIQVFTGYCDTTPYLQLHPGTVTIDASCTLKRLLYTYWDPGLPFMQEWLLAHGWISSTLGGGSGIVNPDATRDQGQGKLVSDGSLGKLLFDVLNEIGGWPEENIYIEQLPYEVITMVSNLYEKDKDASIQSEKDFQQMLRDIIGYSSQGGAGVGGGTLDPGGSGPPSETVVTEEEVGFAMLRAGFPADPQVLANGMETMEGESAFGANTNGWGLNSAGCCAGYWQIYLSVHNVSMDCANNLDCSTKVAYNIWKGAGGCFACQPGPNPWEGGTDSSTKYLSIANRVIDAAKREDQQNKQLAKDPNGESQGR